MAWKYNGIRIYVAEHNIKKEQVIARLQPLTGTTILHVFGNTANVVTVAGLVATEQDKNHLESLTTSGVAYTLSGPEGVIDDYYLHNIQSKRTPSVNSSFLDRPSLDCDVPVYEVNLELFK